VAASTRAPAARRASAALALLAAGAGLAACGGGSPRASAQGSQTVSVFKLRPGECVVPPKANPNLEVSSVAVVACSEPHTEEVFCVLPYSPTPPRAVPHCPSDPPAFAGQLTADYPGEKALETFANAMCLNEFQPYDGRAYKDSSLYFTYLYPSPRSWDDATRRDRAVACLLVTTGAPLTRSAKGSEL
jgi:hypothetical protein